ncbi:MAG: hypothetical protein JRJ46_07900 [Deltaproteobacteria bacterium]|jgi:predicted nuclease of restriction endonuclease-like (RecB) superfamily|nr:hypothetical protein [Deltaproteobacteria bacterium]
MGFILELGAGFSFIARQKRIAGYKRNIAIKIADPSNQQIQDIL